MLSDLGVFNIVGGLKEIIKINFLNTLQNFILMLNICFVAVLLLPVFQLLVMQFEEAGSTTPGLECSVQIFPQFSLKIIQVHSLQLSCLLF